MRKYIDDYKNGWFLCLRAYWTRNLLQEWSNNKNLYVKFGSGNLELFIMYISMAWKCVCKGAHLLQQVYILQDRKDLPHRHFSQIHRTSRPDSQEKPCASVSFLIKLQACNLQHFQCFSHISRQLLFMTPLEGYFRRLFCMHIILI